MTRKHFAASPRGESKSINCNKEVGAQLFIKRDLHERIVPGLIEHEKYIHI